MKIIIILLPILLFTESFAQTKPKVLPENSDHVEALKKLVGKVVECEMPKGKADVLFYSPHIIGVWSEKIKDTIEYFRTDFIGKDGKVYYEEAFFGRPDFKTFVNKPQANKNRRIEFSVNTKGEISLYVANGIEPKTRKPINPATVKCKEAGAIKKYFSPKS